MKKHIFPVTFFLISVISWLICYPSIANQVPIHWGVDGPDNYASKGSAFLIINGLIIFIYIMMMAVPKIDPKKKNYQYFSRGYMFIVNAMVVLFFVLSMLTLMIGLGYNIPMERLVGPFVGLLFIVLGNYLQQAKPNFFFGMRTPWTLSNEEVWRKTHRLSSKLFIVGGLLIILTIFLPSSWEIYVILTVVVIISLILYIYSYLLFRKLED